MSWRSIPSSRSTNRPIRSYPLAVIFRTFPLRPIIKTEPVVLGACCLSILQKVEKLIRHEVSARKLGSIAEADAFAAKARQLILQHRVDRLAHNCADTLPVVDTDAVTAQQAGISSLRTRQEWSERLAAAVAGAFHCEVVLRSGSNTVIFLGHDKDRKAAASLYSELAGKAFSACEHEFKQWKLRRQRMSGLNGSDRNAAYSRRWKQSFLLGFAQTICQRFICDHNCMHACQHAEGLVRIGARQECPAKMPQGRPIGGIDLLYDAVYRGQALAIAVVLDPEHRCAA